MYLHLIKNLPQSYVKDESIPMPYAMLRIYDVHVHLRACEWGERFHCLHYKLIKWDVQ